jgi:ferredoxin-NADP reductase
VERTAVLGRLDEPRPARLPWRVAGVTHVRPETAHASTLVLDVPGWPGHLAGQHVDVRLTAEDGYQAERSYSIASGPEDTALELTVERLDDGEVSPYLTDVLQPGDPLELRGPIGGYFAWRAQLEGPLLMVAGGSGVVPMRSMLRHRAAAGGRGPATLLLSAQHLEDVIYREELDAAASAGVDVRLTLTRGAPPGWDGYSRRVDREMLAEVGPPPSQNPRVYVCGPTPFVENAADLLVELGHPPGVVHTERFGPTGG